MVYLRKRKAKKLKKKGYDLALLAETQPQGNITFKENDNYWKSGDGYHGSLFVTEWPSGGLTDFWGAELMLVNDAISFMHVDHLDNKKVQKKAESSVEEKTSRVDTNQTAAKNRTEAEEAAHLLELVENIRRNNMGVKGLWVRIYPSGDTELELAKRKRKIKDGAPHFHLETFIGEQDLEYHAPFVPPQRQRSLPNHRDFQPAPIWDFAAAYWFNHTKLSDKHGTYFGFTPTNGAVNFDFLQNDDVRTRPFMIISGAPKMWQKRFFLKHSDALFFRGHKQINIDLDDTFLDLTKKQYGKLIDISNGQNRINIFQVFATVTKEVEGENGELIQVVDEVNSFRVHVAKLLSIAQVLNKDISLEDFETIVIDFYVSRNLWKKNADADPDSIHITTLIATEHPRLSDFTRFVHRVYRQAEARGNDVEIEIFRKIKNAFDSLYNNFASIFDVYTEFEDLSEEQVVTIRAASLKSTPNIMNIQLIQVLSLVSSYVVRNSEKQRARRKEHPEFTTDQFEHYIINISAAQNMFDPRYYQSLGFLARIAETMGTNYGGMVLEMSNLQNLLKANVNQDLDSYTVAIREIFALIQYRVFAATDESSVHLLAETLSGSLTESELETLPRLVKGQLFMNIAGYGNIVFNQQFLGEENERYLTVE